MDSRDSGRNIKWLSLWLSSSVENRHTWQPNDSMHQEGTHSYSLWGCSLVWKLQTRLQFISHKTEANANSHKDKQNTVAILLSRWNFPMGSYVWTLVSWGQCLWAIKEPEPCWRKWGCQRIALRLHSLTTSCHCHFPATTNFRTASKVWLAASRLCCYGGLCALSNCGQNKPFCP